MTRTRPLLATLLATLLALIAPTASAENCPQSTPSAASDVAAVVAVLPAPGDEVPVGDSGQAIAALERLFAGPKLAEMPASFGFPSEFILGARYAMDDSFPGGRSQEQGGLLVKNADGSWEFKRGPAGQSAMWTPNYDDQDEGETLYALLHTHPYDQTEGGFTHVAFSGEDIALLAVSDEPIMVVQSGSGLFAMARSKEFNDWIGRYSWQQRDGIWQQMVSHYNLHFQRALNQGTAFPDAIDYAAREVAREYKLAYYAGEAGHPLERIDTSR